MSRRDDRDRIERERQRDVDRERESRRVPTARQNEYFLPKEGIDREVITADICRYLGQDALVRPGYKMDPQTRQQQEGYIISAYRNLTSAMIADLKADSLRWEHERRTTRTPYAYEQYPSSYATSQTHRARHEQGPTNTSASMNSMNTPYATAAPTTGYDDGRGQYGAPQPQQQQYPTAMQTGYGQQHQDYPQEGQFTYGAAYTIDNSTPGRRGPSAPQPPTSGYARDSGYAAPTTVYPSASDPRYGGYAQPAVPTSAYGQQGQQPTDPSYGRGTSYEQPEYAYDYGDTTGRPYVDQNQYTTSSSMAPAPSTTVTADPNPRRQHGDNRHDHSKRSNNRRTG